MFGIPAMAVIAAQMQIRFPSYISVMIEGEIGRKIDNESMQLF